MQAATEKINRSSRIRFIDDARGVAVLLMIAVHVTDAFLAAPFKEGWLWYQIDILYGFVAPAFIFFSGLTLQIALERRRQSGRSSLDLVWRALFILALGYWLHIPSHSLRRALHASAAQAFYFFDCNVLQLIGVSMLLVLAVVMLVRDMRRAAWILSTVGVIVAVLTPVLWHVGAFEGLPSALRLYFLPEGSFPLFPCAAYFLIGFGVAAPLIRAKEEKLGPGVLIGAGLGMILIAYILQLLLLRVPPFDDFWRGGPTLVLFRLGGIVAVAGVLMFLERYWKNGNWLERIGRASLGIYVLHLMLIYGSPITMGMRDWFGGAAYRAMTPLQTAMIFIAVAVIVWAVVDAWRWFREKSPRWSLWLTWGWWVGFAVLFLVAG